MITFVAALGALVMGLVLGYLLRTVMRGRALSAAESRARLVVTEAQEEAQTTVRRSLAEVKEEIGAMRREAEEEIRTRREESGKQEERQARREEALERKARQVEQAEVALKEDRAALAAKADELRSAGEDIRLRLERVASMTAQEAKEALAGQMRDAAKREAMASVREMEERAREEAEERARKIVTIAIQRVAAEQTADASVAVFPLPSDDLKGRIIGREGRNIRHFEALTGVNLIIDDTPEAVVLSSFDPVRREVGRLTLEKLVQDGRIHPARVEEMYERSVAEVEEQIRRAGEQAVIDVGLTDVHPEMIRVLGRLQFRTSYGQNVLRHLVESAHIAGVMAAELGMEPTIVKRAALMHDIGKAVTHEVEGSHALIGAELARRLKESPEVVHAIESHHGEVEQRTVVAVLAQAADQISGGRPGARRESIEQYVKRLERLEEICSAHPGVEKVYAMQAGREVRVMVEPETVDDLAAQVLARDIAKKVEEELQYPGQIKITVVRETRAVELAK